MTKAEYFDFIKEITYFKEENKLVVYITKEEIQQDFLDTLKSELSDVKSVEIHCLTEETPEQRIKKREEIALDEILKNQKNYSNQPSEPSAYSSSAFPTKFKRKSKSLFQDVPEPYTDLMDIMNLADNEIQSSIKGLLYAVDKRETKNGNIEFKLFIRDEQTSIEGICYTQKKDEEKTEQALHINHIYAIKGLPVRNTYTRSIEFKIKCMQDLGKKKGREDLYPKKRVELHAHTTKSACDGLIPIEQLIDQAMKWNHPAIAITDKDSVHAYIDAYDYAKGKDIQVIYGLEGVIYDDITEVIPNDLKFGIKDSYVALDIETTGLSLSDDEVIEIGAVKIVNGNIVDRFERFIHTDATLSQEISELTGIYQNMIENAPPFEEVMTDFIQFSGDLPLVAHNASFDIPLINSQLKKRMNTELTNPVIDTLVLSQIFLDKIKRHGLGRVTKHLKITLESHHRAFDDALACGNILIRLLQMMHQRGIDYISDCNQLIDLGAFRLQNSFKKPVCFLVKNQVGLKNLYKMFSEANLNSYSKGQACYSYSLINRYREGVLVGASGLNNEIFEGLLSLESREKYYDFYDYVEVYPARSYNDVYRKSQIKSVQKYEEMVRTIVNESSIPVVASSDVRYLDSQDRYYRNIIRYGQNRGLSLEEQSSYYFYTTDEMIESFKFLGKDAEKIVIDNPKIIVEKIEPILPLPQDKYPPVIEGSDTQLREMCYKRAHELYGEELPEIIAKRLEYELSSIINNGYAVLYIAAQKLVDKSMEHDFLVGSRGSVGSSLAATMAGITEVNPMPAHYLCPNCKYTEFFGEEVDNAFDLPIAKCPKCGTIMDREGYNIPFESFMGFEGNKEPDIDLNFSPHVQGIIHRYTGEIFGDDYVFRAGTTTAIKENMAIGYARAYYEHLQLPLSNTELRMIQEKTVGVSKSTGQHPGGIIVLPRDMDIYDFTPIQYPAGKVDSGVITTHFDYGAMKGKLLKLDILGHDVPSVIHHIQKITGFDAKEIPLNDEKVLSIFCSTEALSLDPEKFGMNVGTLGIPEFGTSFVRGMLEEVKPKSIGDLVRISGLSHGTDVWLNNAQDLLKNGTINFKDVIATREQVMLYCIEKGIDRNISFEIMNKVKKGKELTEEEVRLMKEAKVPDWYIDACNKIKYMFPKAHAVAYVQMALRIAYYKVYYPEAFYAAHFSTKIDFTDANVLIHPDCIDKRMKELENKPDKSKKDEHEMSVLEIAREMNMRNIYFLPIDLYKSHATDFTVEDGKIRLPLSSLPGLGKKAAISIVEARNQASFLSVEDLKNRATINTTSIEALRDLGCLENLSASNQLNLFEI